MNALAIQKALPANTGEIEELLTASGLPVEGVRAHLLGQARSEGIRRLVLLTTTAEAYFAVRGFRKIPAEAIRGPLRESAEFRGACPSSATCMELVL